MIMKKNPDTSIQRKVIYSQMVSLDGFTEGLNREIDWSAPDEELFKYINNQEDAFDTHLYGRRTYENMASYWPTADTDPLATENEIEFARKWKEVTKIVFSKTLDRVEGNARVVKNNITQEIKKLKEQPGKDMVLGGSNIATTFMKLNLIDEYWLYIHPVVLGNGTPMFKRLDDRINLQLVKTRTFDSRVVHLRYQRIDQSVE
ncbi:Dihydrofolate reductase [Lentibacillus halodurans]|uniref:Dihydrofolate reductase n=1 Tax=Lentibacillus halodurans TaxID=237679 RepID=A0A1I1AAX3_9BACI|nr:dihydrofolate reductase family protein [Lentibacillus halodurans]SFB34506.1 Dihydrofolate reductase [Lentibacillus halodurans]